MIIIYIFILIIMQVNKVRASHILLKSTESRNPFDRARNK